MPRSENFKQLLQRAELTLCFNALIGGSSVRVPHNALKSEGPPIVRTTHTRTGLLPIRSGLDKMGPEPSQ
eukprot:3512371-Amphidinium_carterae.1